MPDLIDRPRRFSLRRYYDVTGVAGTGVVAMGVEFPDGTVAMRWCVPPAVSTSLWASIDDLITVHGHDGATHVLWLD